jgi:hypothetical protein
MEKLPMSIIKLAYHPVIVVNQDSGNSSKTLSGKNVAAALTGATTGFAAKEGVGKILNKDILSHRYGRRMAGVAGGLIGASAAYKALNKHHEPQMYMF